MTFEPMTFERWAVLNADLAPVEIKCPACDGEGTIECRCCGNEKTCVRCNGKGKQFEGPTLAELYKAEVEHEQKRYERFVATPIG